MSVIMNITHDLHTLQAVQNTLRGDKYDCTTLIQKERQQEASNPIQTCWDVDTVSKCSMAMVFCLYLHFL